MRLKIIKFTAIKRLAFFKGGMISYVDSFCCWFATKEPVQVSVLRKKAVVSLEVTLERKGDPESFMKLLNLCTFSRSPDCQVITSMAGNCNNIGKIPLNCTAQEGPFLQTRPLTARVLFSEQWELQADFYKS